MLKLYFIAKTNHGITHIKTQMIRKAIEELNKRKFNMMLQEKNSPGTKGGVPSQEGFDKRASFLVGPCRVRRPHGYIAYHFST